MVDAPVSLGSGRYLTCFALDHDKMAVRPRTVGLLAQFFLQVQQVLIQVVLEFSHLGPLAFAPLARLAVGLIEILKGIYLRVKVL